MHIAPSVAAIVLGALAGSPAPRSRTVTSERAPASLPASLNRYANLPCATKAEFAGYAAKLHLKNQFKGELCGDASDLERFGKLLKLMASLHADVPADWKGGALPIFASPLDFVATTNKTMQVDLSQKETIAYNQGGDVYLGGLFFTDPPLDQISTLLHETRHSVASAADHVTCKAGDRANDPASCDEYFSRGDDAGAYSYEVSYGLGFARHGFSRLTRADREFLAADGLSTLGRRLNRVPEKLGLPFETIVALDSSGELFRIHPITGRVLQAPPWREKIARIKFSRGVNGAFVFGRDGHVSQLDFQAKEKPYHEGDFPQGALVRDAERMSSGTGDAADVSDYFITGRDRLYSFDFDSTRKAWRAKALAVQAPEGVELERLANGSSNIRYALARGGALYEIGDGSLNASAFRDPDGRGWQDVSGGVLFSQLFGVSLAGKLLRWDGSAARAGLDSPEPLRRYLEAANFRILLGESGRVYTSEYGEGQQISEVAIAGRPRKIVEIAAIRSFLPDASFDVGHSPDAAFAACKVAAPLFDPWSGRSFGVDADGALVFEGEGAEPCVRLPASSGIGRITGISFVSTPTDASPNLFSQVSLHLSTAGDAVELRPYLPFSATPR
jgi:hypothetical protein